MKKATLLLFLLFVLPYHLSAAVTPLDAALATTGNGTTLTYPVSAGTNRYLEVGVGCEGSCGNSPTVDIGGQTPVELRTCAATDNGRITVFGLDEAGIAARTGDLITVSGSGTRTIIIARSKEGVNQANPVPETDCDFTAESTPNPITTSVINATEGSSVSSFAFNGTGSDAVSPPNTCSWANTTLRHTENGTSEALSFADTFPTVSGNVNPQCTWDEQPRAVLISLELQAMPASEIDHGWCIDTTQQTHTGDALWNTEYTCAGSNFPSPGDYALFVYAHRKDDDTGATHFGIRAGHGATPTVFADSTALMLQIQTSAERFHGYWYFTRFTQPATPEDIVIQLQIEGGVQTVAGESVSILFFKLDDLAAAKWAHAINTTDTELTTTPQNFANASLTADAGDTVAAWCNWRVDGGSTEDNFIGRININSGADVGHDFSYEVDPGSSHSFGTQRTFSASSGSNTVSCDASQDAVSGANGITHLSSEVILVNLTDSFLEHAAVYDASTVAASTGWNELGTLTPTPTEVHPWFLFGAASETSSGAADRFRLRIDNAEANIPLGMEDHTHCLEQDGAEGERCGLAFGVAIDAVPTSAQDWDLDAQEDSSIVTTTFEDRSFFAFSTGLPASLPAGTSISTINVYEAIFNSPFVVFPQNLPNGDAGEVYAGATITAIGGADPFTWSISSGALPTGLSINSTTGEISGTIDAGEAEGNKEFVVQALDVNGGKATGDFVIFVSNPVDPDPPFEPPVWVQPYDTFTALRTHYVDDIACGGTGTLADPECLTDAKASGHLTGGDVHILRTGTYITAGTLIDFNVDCTEANPCIWKAFIDTAGQPERVQFPGQVRVTGAWNWFWAVNIYQSVAGSGNCFQMRDSGVRLINSVLPECAQGTSVDSFNWGSGMVTYGNIQGNPGSQTTSPPPHNIYTQNDFDANGWKYHVGNYYYDCYPLSGGSTNGSQCNNNYGTNAHVEGLHYENNFYYNPLSNNNPGRISIRGGNDTGNTTKEFVFNSNMVIEVASSSDRGFWIDDGSSAAFTFTNNYLARSVLSPEGIWSNNAAPHITRIENNEFYEPKNGYHYRHIATMISGGTIGLYKFDDTDVWDNNTFGGTFKAANLRCNGSNFSGNMTLAQWRTNTDNCRQTPDAGDANGFDINSTEVANPTVNKIKVIRNDYARLDGHYWGQVGIVNWEGVTSDIVDIAPLGLAGKTYVVRYAEDFYGTTAASGTCPGSGACDVTLATKTTDAGAAGQFYSHFIVIGQPDAP